MALIPSPMHSSVSKMVTHTRQTPPRVTDASTLVTVSLTFLPCPTPHHYDRSAITRKLLRRVVVRFHYEIVLRFARRNQPSPGWCLSCVVPWIDDKGKLLRDIPTTKLCDDAPDSIVPSSGAKELSSKGDLRRLVRVVSVPYLQSANCRRRGNGRTKDCHRHRIEPMP